MEKNNGNRAESRDSKEICWLNARVTRETKTLVKIHCIRKNINLGEYLGSLIERELGKENQENQENQ